MEFDTWDQVDDLRILDWTMGTTEEDEEEVEIWK